MPTPILVTKLFAPLRVKQAVSRGALVEQLNSGLARKLTLVCAPAGFGKSSLLSCSTSAPRCTACLTRNGAKSLVTRMGVDMPDYAVIRPRASEFIMARKSRLNDLSGRLRHADRPTCRQTVRTLAQGFSSTLKKPTTAALNSR